MSAGTGILHSEKNDSWTDRRQSQRVHFVQMWVVPDEAGIEPGYQQAEIDDELLRGGLVTIASGMPDTTTRPSPFATSTPHCTAGACRPATVVELPDAPFLHLFVARGEVTLEGAGRCTRATPCGSPPRADSASPQPNRPRSSSGRCMPIWPPRNGLVVGLVGLVVLSGCSPSTESAPPQSPAPASSTAPAAPASGSPNLVSTPLDVPGDLAQSPLDEPRQALVPEGWTIVGVGADPEGPAGDVDAGRRAAGIGARDGQILKLTPKPGAAPQQSMLLEGLDQPHGLAFAGSTLYVAESDQVDAYDYADGAAINPRTVAADLPDARSADLTAPTRTR